MNIVDKENYQQLYISEYTENWTLQQDIPYYDNPPDEYAKERCFLDVYYPQDRKNAPTLVYFHGGGIKNGDKSGVFDVWKLLGCTIISVNYRLSPRAKCPDYIYDAAAAAAWAIRNTERFNGSRKNIFVTGASAGAYLTAMLAADPKYLGHFGLSPEDFTGYLPISGEMITHFTIREERGIPNTVQMIDEYAPLNFVRKDFPPFLMLTGQTRMEIDCRPSDNKLMWEALRFCGNETCEYYELPNLTHGNIWHAVLPYMFSFIKNHFE